MRVFVAVDVSEEGKEEFARLQQELLASGSLNRRDLKPIEKQNFHFTLIFLGEKNDNDVDRIKDKLSQIQFSPVKLTYTGIGGFPGPDRARVIWSGVDPDGADNLKMLANNVVSKMGELGFKADKPFSPHMTLFRVRADKGHVSLGGLAEKYRDKKIASDAIDTVHLKKSDLTPTGPTYSDIFTVVAQR